MKDKVVICNHESFVCNLIPCVFFVIINRIAPYIIPAKEDNYRTVLLDTIYIGLCL